MVALISALLFAPAVFAVPLNHRRAVQSLNQAAFEEAQQVDNTATKAFSATEIKTSNGQCLFSDILSGDFRANLTPVQVAACNGKTNQKWDVITKGKHNDQAGTALFVNSETHACLNFDPRRAAGNQVLLFSCGGRADGGGQVTDSQLFPFKGGNGPLTLTPKNAAGTCLTVKGTTIDQAPCKAGDATQSFTIGAGSAAPAPASSAPAATSAAAVTSAPAACGAPPAATSTAPPAESSAPASSAAPQVTAAPGNAPSANPTTPVPVSRAGGVLQPSAAAEANQFDATATRAFKSVSLKAANGQCLFIDPTAGDFRQNLIPIAVKDCDGSPNEKFDFITSGKHNNAKGSTLIVSSLMNGCVNFDDRRAAGDKALMFSCGGRADGDSQTTDSQLFTFTPGQKTIVLAPQNAKGKTCLVPNGAVLSDAACTGDASQVFTIVQ